MASVGASGQSDKREIATDVWRLIADFTYTRFQRGEHMGVLRSLGLTPGHLQALGGADPAGAPPDASHGRGAERRRVDGDLARRPARGSPARGAADPAERSAG